MHSTNSILDINVKIQEKANNTAYCVKKGDIGNWSIYLIISTTVIL